MLFPLVEVLNNRNEADTFYSQQIANPVLLYVLFPLHSLPPSSAKRTSLSNLATERTFRGRYSSGCCLHINPRTCTNMLRLSPFYSICDIQEKFRTAIWEFPKVYVSSTICHASEAAAGSVTAALVFFFWNLTLTMMIFLSTGLLRVRSWSKQVGTRR